MALRPDALALGGDEGLGALESAPRPAALTLDPNRAIIFSGDCRGRGSSRLAARARVQAGAFGLCLVHPAAGCAIPVLHERGLAGPGDLVAACPIGLDKLVTAVRTGWDNELADPSIESPCPGSARTWWPLQSALPRAH